MHVVALTRWGPPLEGELPALAAHLDALAYDLRLRLAGGLPAVFVTVDDDAEANRHVEFLRARGHGAVRCDMDELPAPEDQCVPLHFELSAAAVCGTLVGNRRFDVPYAEIMALVRAASVTSAEQTKTTQEKKLSLGRAVVTGGLMMRKKVDRIDKKMTMEQEQMLYMFRRGEPSPYVWKELTLHYQGLGDDRKLTTAQNFAELTDRLRAHAPHAFCDERLLTQKRRAGITSLAGGAKDRRIEISNVRENDLTVFLLLRAHFEGQL
jgi:hypothetical protein